MFLIVIGGATASGKTTLAIEIAKRYHTEIVSADSRQFYREMSIGTAKPSEEELGLAVHHGINSLSIQDAYSVGDFERFALEKLGDIFSKNRVAVLVGGSGLFIRAVCEGLDTFPEVSEQTRQLVQEKESEEGLPWLQNQLAKLDPVYFEKVDQNNPARLRRALEVCLESGQPYSDFLKNDKKDRPFTPIYILTDWPREKLYERINQRVDQMIEAGLEEEARSLLPYRNLPALKTVGYEEWFDYFDGKYTREECVEKIKQHTRNYAKRQATWFRKHGNWKSFSPENKNEVFEFLDLHLA